MQTIQELIDNPEKMEILVKRLYMLVRRDPLIKHFFKKVDRSTLERKQTWFLTSLILGKNQGTIDYMSQTHRQLVKGQGLNANHFDTMLNCMTRAMSDSDVSKPVATEILKAANTLKSAILGTDI